MELEVPSTRPLKRARQDFSGKSVSTSFETSTQLEASIDQEILSEWEPKLSADVLLILWQAGFKSHRTLASLRGQDLADAAEYIGIRLSPGVKREWEAFMAEKARNRAMGREVELGPLRTKMVFWSDLWIKEKAEMPVLEELHVEISINDWTSFGSPGERGLCTNSVEFEMAGRDWRFSLYPYGSPHSKSDACALYLYLHDVDKTKQQEARSHGYPVDFVIDIRESHGISVFGEEIHHLFQGGKHAMAGTAFKTKRIFDEAVDLKACEEEMSAHLFVRLYQFHKVCYGWQSTATAE